MTDPIKEAYTQYDSDKRVNGPDDYEAFKAAVESAYNGFIVATPDELYETLARRLAPDDMVRLAGLLVKKAGQRTVADRKLSEAEQADWEKRAG